MANKYALLIGNDGYSDKHLAELTVPVHDVSALENVLKRKDVCSFDNVKVLLNQSLSKVMAEVGALFANKKRDDLVLLYFSGHGLVDRSGDLYLALKETNFEIPLGTALPSSFIKEAMNKSFCRRQVLILDCCHSGAFERGTKGVGAAAMTEATFEVSGYGREILTSSAATQLSWEGSQVTGDTDKSLFTRYLVEGLESGQAAPEGEEEITVEQLYHYAHDKVVSLKPEMKPQRWVDRQQGTFVIAHNPKPAIQPKPLPKELREALEDERFYVRVGAVRQELSRWYRSEDPAEALAAQQALGALKSKERDVGVLAAIDELLGVPKPAPRPKPKPKPQKPKEKPKEKPKADEDEYVMEVELPPLVKKQKHEKAKGKSGRRFVWLVVFVLGLALFQLWQSGFEGEDYIPGPRPSYSEIGVLLDKADEAFADLRLTTPQGISAADYYYQVLNLDPGNIPAQRGLDRIVEKYIGWVELALSEGNLDKAASNLAKAESIDPNHEGVRWAREQLSAISQPTQKTRDQTLDEIRAVIEKIGTRDEFDQSSSDPLWSAFERQKAMEDQPKLGVMIEDMTPQSAAYFGITQRFGALIVNIIPGSPAAYAGFWVGDVIVEIDGQPVTYAAELPTIMNEKSPGQSVHFVLYRNDMPGYIDMIMVGESMGR